MDRAEVPGPSLEQLRAGLAQPSREQLGGRVDLPSAIRAKFETAFGADLSAVRLYQSEAVADAGAEAVAQGNRVAFAPEALDFSSRSGQRLLGHELSHVLSQRRGEVSGTGFLRDAGLEARADREGAMAAEGQSVAMPAGPLSPASAASAAGPMQASKKDAEIDRDAALYNQRRAAAQNLQPERQGQQEDLAEQLEQQENLAEGQEQPELQRTRSQSNLPRQEEPAEEPKRSRSQSQGALSRPQPLRTGDGEGNLAQNLDVQQNAQNAQNAEDAQVQQILNNAQDRPGEPKVSVPWKATKHLSNANAFVKGMAQNAALATIKASNAGHGFADINNLKGGAYAKNMIHANGTMNALGAVTGAAATLTSGAATVRAIQNLKVGGSGMDVVNNGLDTLANGAGTVSSLLGLANNLTQIGSYANFINHAKGAEGLVTMAQMGSSGSQWIPGLGVAAGGLSMITGTSQAIQGGRALTKLKKAKGGFDTLNGDQPLTKDQELMRRTFEQGIQVQERNRTGGILKAISGGLNATSSALTLGGVSAPIGAVFGALGAGVGAANSIFNYRKTKGIRRNALAEDLNIDWKRELKNVQQQFGLWARLTRGRKIILRSRSLQSGENFRTEDEAFAKVRSERANNMLRMAKSGNANEKRMAETFLSAMGVKKVRNKNTGEDEYAKDAAALLAGKLA